MKKVLIFISLSFFILIIGCAEDDDIQNKLIRENIKEIPIESEEKQKNIGLGNLCSNEDECNSFCLNNRGRCEQYCKINTENELCKKIFTVQNQQTSENENKDEIKVEEKQEQMKEDKLPVLKNIGFNIEPWNKETNLAGDLIFAKKLIFNDGHISNDKVFVEFGHTDSSRPGQPWVEYWFFVPLGTKVKAPVDGTAHIGFFNHTQDWGINIGQGSGWTVSFEHVVNVVVKDGAKVKAGDIIAEAAPRNTYNYEIAMTELAVWQGGRNVIKHCPFSFLEESLKPKYEEKINRLTKDWEEFIGKDVYQQEKWVAPGCLLPGIIEK